MTTKIGTILDENNEKCILIRTRTEDLLRLERIFKGLSHCLIEFYLSGVISLENEEVFSIKLVNSIDNVGLEQTKPNYFEWRERSETWYIFKEILTMMYRNSNEGIHFELTRDIKNQNGTKILIYWER